MGAGDRRSYGPAGRWPQSWLQTSTRSSIESTQPGAFRLGPPSFAFWFAVRNENYGTECVASLFPVHGQTYSGTVTSQRTEDISRLVVTLLVPFSLPGPPEENQSVPFSALSFSPEENQSVPFSALSFS